MESQPNVQKIPWHLITIFFLLTIGILIVGYFYYEHQVTYLKQEKQNELTAIMNMKIGQIANWRQERVADANVLFDDSFLALRIKNLLEGRGTPELKGRILSRMAALRFYQYQYIALLNSRGDVILSYPEGKWGHAPLIIKLAKEAMQTQKIIFSDLYRNENGKAIHLSLIVPILVGSGPGKNSIGVIVIGIDPHQFLYPLIQSWPTPSRTAEAELLRREGNEVVLLNELRHRQGTALTLRFPLTETELLAAMAVRGEKGVVEGKDYRGVAVLGVVGGVPDSPWFLAVEVDAQEVLAPVLYYFQVMLVLMITLIAAAGLGLAFIWRNQQATFYRRQFEIERDKRSLALRYEYLTRYANDIILLIDQDLQIVEANERAMASYGYGRDELLTFSLKELHPPETQSLLDDRLQHAGDQDGLIFEASQLRRDGTIFPAEISLCLIDVEGQKVYQEIIRNITERKLAEESLRALTAELLTAQEAERRRISLFLHDDLGQALMVLKFQMSTIKDKLRKDRNILSNDCEELLHYLKNLIDKVRQLSRDLNPPTVLEDLGLGVALKYLIEEFGKHYNIQPNRVDIDEIDQLFSKQAQINIYRIFQECLTNIGRHAQATQISIDIKKMDDRVSFMIQDDGEGFDMKLVLGQKTMSPGLGIPAMTERVKILGGSIDIRSKKGTGTRIIFDIPIDTK